MCVCVYACMFYATNTQQPVCFLSHTPSGFLPDRWAAQSHKDSNTRGSNYCSYCFRQIGFHHRRTPILYNTALAFVWDVSVRALAFTSGCVFLSPRQTLNRTGMPTWPFRKRRAAAWPSRCPPAKSGPCAALGGGTKQRRRAPASSWPLGTPTAVSQTLRPSGLQTGCNQPFACACTKADWRVCIHFKARSTLSGLAVYSAGCCLPCCHCL